MVWRAREGGSAAPSAAPAASAARLRVDELDVAAYTVPTDAPESDGTHAWDSTTIVVVEARAAGVTGIGYTYGHASVADLIRDPLSQLVCGRGAMDVAGVWDAMRRALRNIGARGPGAHAIGAVDTALWDLKARLLDLPLVALLGQRREAAPLYGSGGFTSYGIDRLRSQLAGWVEAGLGTVKMKVGREPAADPERVAAARDAVGSGTELFVDANGAYTRKQALRLAESFAVDDVRWFEEPVSSDDLAGLRLLRDRAPASMDIAAGEYGYDPSYFRDMLGAGAVDVLQADATRCGGFTGFLHAAALCEAHGVPLSAHTAPLLHLHVGCAAPALIHLEYFHDHVRLERLLFDGVPEPEQGALRPDLARAGMGFSLARERARPYRSR